MSKTIPSGPRLPLFKCGKRGLAESDYDADGRREMQSLLARRLLGA